MYQILDLQIKGRYFADGALFKNKEEIRQQLISYHSEDAEDDDLETLYSLSLEGILVYGDWAIVPADESKPQNDVV